MPASDLFQEGAIAAWLAEADYDPQYRISLFSFTWNAARRQMLNYLVSPPSNRQERAPISYDNTEDSDDEPLLAKRDFVPFLIDVMTPEPEPTISDTLTPQELKCLRVMCTGIIAKEAAEQIGITRRTIEGHLKNVYRKWKVTTLIQAFIEGMRRGLVEPPKRREEE